MFFYPQRIKFKFPRIKVAEHEIFIPQTLDSLNIPIQGGLQDTMLGPQPHETQCAKCHLNYFACPGHFGEIALQTMIINPLLFKDLFMIVRLGCTKCHRFRIPTSAREHVLKNTGERLVAAMKENVEDRCPYCTSRSRLSKLNLKIVSGTQYVQPFRVYRIVRALFENERSFFERMRVDYKAFFMHKVFVLPNKFRPLNRMNDKIFESAHNIHLSRIVKINQVLKDEIERLRMADEEGKRVKGRLEEEKIENRIKGRVEGERKIEENKRVKGRLEEENKIKGRVEEEKIENKLKDKERQACKNEQGINAGHGTRDKENADKKQKIQKDNGVNAYIDEDLLHILDRADDHSVSVLNGLINALQCAVQYYFDSTEYPSKRKPPGFKQALEKKEGLFRQNMMGKRVNYTARTVISPDPYIATDEIGIPMHIACRLTFPERVTPFNRRRLERCVINGPVFPGAECIVENGVKRSLKYVKNRRAVAKTLLKNSTVVHRHMQHGDMVLVNRQPTLHKPSLMSHRVRILNDKTIRMHYVNCNSYNADFDGDEMNIHLAQGVMARAENAYLSSTHENYALNGKPVRGLVQDYVVSMFSITLKDRFFSRSEINELLIASRKLNFTITSAAILRPKQLYTGKQLIAMLLSAYDLRINYEHANKISTLYWKEHREESTVRFHNGYYVHGVLDKSEVGPSKNGLVHCIGMLKGYFVCNDVLTALGRMVSRYLVCYGQPLGISDFVLGRAYEEARARIFKEGVKRGDKVLRDNRGRSEGCDRGSNIKGKDSVTDKGSNNFNISNAINTTNNTNFITTNTNPTINPTNPITTNPTINPITNPIITKPIITNPTTNNPYSTPMVIMPKVTLSKNERINLDNTIKKEMHTVTSQVSDLLIKGIETPFPSNKMANIILSGAKGSIVNFSQISGLLGQQSLEGGRVPLMSNGRSLCSFFKSSVLSGGFILDRFLTGLSLSSFFFHCQAGREGLIDTAVKTSRSGYLQRCIVKMMEGTVVEYDMSVRDGMLIQYVYGEDGKDPNRMVDERFMAMNGGSIRDGSNDEDSCRGSNDKDKDINNNDKNNDKDTNINTNTNANVNTNYINQRVHPGESVGMIAAQAIGEPSTQMTLNTFHLAGCATNVTLGMPRLKEILMIGNKSINTVIKGKITNRITFDPSTVLLKDALFYYRVVERNETDVLFVLNRSVGNDTMIRFKRMFLKEVNRCMGRGTAVHEVINNNNEDSNDKDGDYSYNEDGDYNYNEDGRNYDNENGKDDNSYDKDDKDDDYNGSYYNGSYNENGKDSNVYNGNSYENDNDYDNDNDKDDNYHGSNNNKIHNNNRTYTEQEMMEQIKECSWSSNVIRMTLSSCVPVSNTVEKMRETFKVVDSDITHMEILNNDVTVSGCNYYSLFDYVPSHGVYLNDYINFYTCISNDIYNTWEVLGIEACRAVIIREVRAVFQAYGIEIDIRHLMLIADKMTVTGEYVAFNRHKMSGSVLGKMSFESTYNFLRKAYLYGGCDELEGPSARVALGLPVRNGTGMFDLLYEDNQGVYD